MYGPYLYCEMANNNTKPIFTYNWNQARYYEDEQDCLEMRKWLANWDSNNSYKMKDWTRIVSSFKIVKVAISPYCKNIKVRKNK